MEKIIPIYLNQRIVFDLLAIIENGFSSMYSVQRKQSASGESETSIEAEVGTGNLFTFLSAKLGAKASTSDSELHEEDISEERIHTPASLFSKLMDYLSDEIKVVNSEDDVQKIKTGDFIKFKGEIKENQLIKIFDSFSSMFSLSHLFRSSSSGKTQGNDNKKTADQIKGLADSMRIAGIVDLICKTNN